METEKWNLREKAAAGSIWLTETISSRFRKGSSWLSFLARINIEWPQCIFFTLDMIKQHKRLLIQRYTHSWHHSLHSHLFPVSCFSHGQRTVTIRIRKRPPCVLITLLLLASISAYEARSWPFQHCQCLNALKKLKQSWSLEMPRNRW